MRLLGATFGILLGALAFIGCESPQTPSRGVGASAIPPLSASDLTLEQAAQAKQLYVDKCARCHKFYDPNQYEKSEWDYWMKAMSRKSRLTAQEEALLAEYLGGFRTAESRRWNP